MARKKRDASKLTPISLDDIDDGIEPNIESDSDGVEVSKPRKSPSKNSLKKHVKDIVYPEDLEADDFTSMSLLDDSEKEFYIKRRRKYLEEFNLNTSSDLGLIHRVVMEEIITERLYKQMINDPGKDLSRQISESQERYKSALDALGASRDKRIKNKESSKLSLSDVVKDYHSNRKFINKSLEERYKAEEEALLAKSEKVFQQQYEQIESSGEDLSLDGLEEFGVD